HGPGCSARASLRPDPPIVGSIATRAGSNQVRGCCLSTPHKYVRLNLVCTLLRADLRPLSLSGALRDVPGALCRYCRTNRKQVRFHAAWRIATVASAEPERVRALR